MTLTGPPEESQLYSDLKDQLAGEWDDCNLPELVTIRGWLLKVTVGGKDKYRIFLNHSASRYYELAIEDVVYSIEPELPDTPQRIWVREGADLRLVTIQSSRAEVRPPQLLSGPIVQSYAAAGPPAPLAGIPVYGGPPAQGGWWPGGGPGEDGGGWEASACSSAACFSHSP